MVIQIYSMYTVVWPERKNILVNRFILCSTRVWALLRNLPGCSALISNPVCLKKMSVFLQPVFLLLAEPPQAKRDSVLKAEMAKDWSGPTARTGTELIVTSATLENKEYCNIKWYLVRGSVQQDSFICIAMCHSFKRQESRNSKNGLTLISHLQKDFIVKLGEKVPREYAQLSTPNASER